MISLMGIRAKVLVAMVALLTLLGTAGMALVHFKLNASLQEHEADQAAQDMRLLQAVLNTELAQIDGVLRSWSNWTELYEHAADPGLRFRAQELSETAVAVAQVDWLTILGTDGRPIEQVSSPFDRDSALALPTAMAELPADTVRHFAALVARTPHACGVAQLEQHLALACYRPLLNSEGRGEPRGTVVIGRRITAELLERIAQQSQMQFHIVPRARAAQGARTAQLPAPVGSRLPRAAPTVVAQSPSHLQVAVPLRDMAQRELAELHLHWPRVALAGANRELRQVGWLVLVMVAGTGLAAILVVDLMVVRRLTSVQAQMHKVVASGHWDGTIRMPGRDEIAGLARSINQIIGVVRHQVAELGQLATTDALTGLGNRRCFDDRLGNMVDRFRRSQRTSSLILVDVDHFKQYNDHYGHPAGDKALQVVADALRQLARRPGDLAARIGGEEFALLFEETDMAMAVSVANAAREALRRAAVAHPSTSAGILTLSCGVTQLRSGDTPHQFYQRADEALYRAKQAGRDRVEVEHPPMDTPSG